MRQSLLSRPGFWAETRLQLRTRYSLLGEFLILLLLYFISSLLQGVLMAVPMTVWTLQSGQEQILSALQTGKSMETLIYELMESMPDWVFLAALFAYGALGAVVLVYVRRFQGRGWSSLGLRRPGIPGCLALGLGLGLLLFSGVLGLGVAAGGYRLLPESFQGSQLLPVLCALAGCLVRGAAMELLLRGYFAPTLGARYPAALALGLSTLGSVMLQSGSLLSMDSVNTLLLSLLLGIWVMKRGELWSACALHGAWTFAQSFLLSFAPAGEHVGIYLLAVDADPYRAALTGGALGPQASICATVVLLAAIGAALALKPRDPAPEEAVQQKPEI